MGKLEGKAATVTGGSQPELKGSAVRSGRFGFDRYRHLKYFHRLLRLHAGYLSASGRDGPSGLHALG